MIVLSLIMVIAAAVSLVIGLFVVTESLTFIFVAIGLCLVSLLLLWLGTRSRKAATAESSAPVYGGARRPAGSTTTARPTSAGGAEEGATVVRKATARGRAVSRVEGGTVSAEEIEEETRPVNPEADEATVTAAASSTPEDEVISGDEAPAPADAPPPAEEPVSGQPAEEPAEEPAASKKAAAAKKATAKKSAKKSSAKKATAKKSTKKASAKKATKKAAKKAAASGGATTGKAAREALAGISGIGPAKQDVLLEAFGSLEQIRDADEEAIAQLKGFGPALARRVKDELS